MAHARWPGSAGPYICTTLVPAAHKKYQYDCHAKWDVALSRFGDGCLVFCCGITHYGYVCLIMEVSLARSQQLLRCCGFQEFLGKTPNHSGARKWSAEQGGLPGAGNTSVDRPDKAQSNSFFVCPHQA